VDAEMALRGCNLRFRRRFMEMEAASSKPLEIAWAGGTGRAVERGEGKAQRQGRGNRE